MIIFILAMQNGKMFIGYLSTLAKVVLKLVEMQLGSFKWKPIFKVNMIVLFFMALTKCICHS